MTQSKAAKRILIVTTSHAQLGNTGKPTGLWLDEFAAPYYRWLDAGFEITIAAPLGGRVPIDPASLADARITPSTQRLIADHHAPLAEVRKLSELHADNFDAVFYPGGHGPMWDLANDCDNARLLADFAAADKVIAAVCHGPAALTGCRRLDNHRPLVEGRRITGFSNREEDAVGLLDVVPFLLETRLKALGGDYSCATPWQEYVVTDGNLITGQNPASASLLGDMVIEML